jgi:hypothetical protein
LHDAETTEDIIDVVLGELGELHAITAQDARLNLLYPPTVQLDLLTRNSFDGDASTYTVRLGDIAADAVRSVAVRVEVPALAEGEKLPFSITLGWKGPGEERHPRIIEHGTSLYIVPPHEAEARGTDLSVVERVADLWEAALAYRTMRYNEQGHFRKASAIYELHDAAFADLVNELPDVSERVGRYHATQRRVSRRWQRRSKRQAYIRSKKAMLAERDLRRGDAGEWHDHLSD